MGKMQNLDSRVRGKDGKEQVDFESTQQDPSVLSRGEFNGGFMQKGKKIIAIGERDGVTGPVIAECLEGAGYEVVFQATECFV